MNNQEITRDDWFLAPEYHYLFQRQWAPWVGGILLGLLNVLMFAYAKPWGVADGIQNWGLWIMKGVGAFGGEIVSPLRYTTSITNLSLVLGAMIAALLSREFSLRLSYRRDIIRGIIGGLLLGVGSVLGIGCTIGGFFTAFSALSLAGPIMMAGLALGVWLGLKILMWDLGRESSTPSSPSATGSSIGGSWIAYQPYLGGALLLAVVAVLLWDKVEFTTSGVTGNRSMLVFFGVALGLVSQRTRFCFVRAFREPFMTGEGSMTRGAALALLVGVLGFAIIKGTELNELRDPMAFVNPSVWLGSLAGGIIFGIGMVLTGGCASGSIWRAGEGQIKFWLVLIAFAISNAVTTQIMRGTNLRETWGDKAYFLPDLWGWPAAIAFLVGIALLWIIFSAWNEKTEKVVML